MDSDTRLISLVYLLLTNDISHALERQEYFMQNLWHSQDIYENLIRRLFSYVILRYMHSICIYYCFDEFCQSYWLMNLDCSNLFQLIFISLNLNPLNCSWENGKRIVFLKFIFKVPSYISRYYVSLLQSVEVRKYINSARQVEALTKYEFSQGVQYLHLGSCKQRTKHAVFWRPILLGIFYSINLLHHRQSWKIKIWKCIYLLAVSLGKLPQLMLTAIISHAPNILVFRFVYLMQADFTTLLKEMQLNRSSLSLQEWQ